MKKSIIVFFIAALPAMVHAQSEGLFGRKTSKETLTNPKYASPSAMTEEDGKIVFRASIAAAGQSKENIYAKVAQWASLRYEPNSTRGVYTDADFYKNLFLSCKYPCKNCGGIFFLEFMTTLAVLSAKGLYITVPVCHRCQP